MLKKQLRMLKIAFPTVLFLFLMAHPLLEVVLVAKGGWFTLGYPQIQAQTNLTVRGLILTFHQLPKDKQYKMVLNLLAKKGLEPKHQIKRFKSLIFGYKSGILRSKQQALLLCQTLSSIPNLKRCEPDILLPIHHKGSTKMTSFHRSMKTKPLLENVLMANLAVEIKTEAFSSTECPFCNEPTPDQTMLETLKPILEPQNIKTCKIVSDKHNLKNGTLSDYWAQEMIGSDLLRGMLKDKESPDKKNFVSVFDGFYQEHGSKVRNLISGSKPHAVLPEIGRKVPMLETKYSGDLQVVSNTLLDKPSIHHPDSAEKPINTAAGLRSNYYPYTLYPADFSLELPDKPLSEEELKQEALRREAFNKNNLEKLKGEVPSFINHSMGWGNFKTPYDSFRALSPPAVVVVAIGNEFPASTEAIQTKASKDFQVVLVGSFAPEGVVSHFSQEHEEVHILAPSDQWISSTNNSGSYRRFGGTSAAAPLVTGSLAGFEWLSDYHPSGKEAKTLLEKTAIPTIHSHEKPRKNGVGLVNSYKLGIVAKRLKEKCQTLVQQSRVKNFAHCMREEIQKDENYKFPKDLGLREELKKVFPACASLAKREDGQQYGAGTCEEQERVFKRLRKAVFLNPENPDLWESLSCIYKEGGFSANALGFERIALAVESREKQIDYLVSSFQNNSSLFKRIGLPLVTELFTSNKKEDLNSLMKSQNKDLRMSMLSLADYIGGKKQEYILKNMMNDEDDNIRQVVAIRSGYMTNGESILQSMTGDPSALVRHGVMEGAESLGGDAGKRILQQIAQEDPDRYLREAARKKLND